MGFGFGNILCRNNERGILVTYRLALIGAGQLGSRHLQALAKSEHPFVIDVVDTSEDSLRSAKERFLKVTGNFDGKKVEYHGSLANIHSKLDLCIIATTSDIRARVTRQLLRDKSVRYILFEKVLFQSLAEYEEITSLLKECKVKAWVNCPRRIYPFYQDLKSRFSPEARMFFVASGGEWGLACNAIHLIDLLAFLTENIDYTLKTDALDPQVRESKRRGFIELTGTLIGHFSNGNEIILHSRAGSSAPLLISIYTSGAEIIVDEEKGIARMSLESNGWNWEDIEFSVPYQSDLTHKVVEEIIKEGICGLTPFEESVKLHKPLLKALLEHLSSIRGEVIDVCPIT
jgi:predicted dehydrogenase